MTDKNKEFNPDYTYKHQENIYNSFGGVYGMSGVDVKFVKDPTKLLIQYDHLIKATVKEHIAKFSGSADKQELYDQVVTTFINLVKEYDPYSGIDFPGYIKINLGQRIRYSYVQSQMKHRRKESPMKTSHIPIGNDDTDLFDFIALQNNNVVLNKNGTIMNYNSNNLIDDSLLDLYDKLKKRTKLDTIDYFIIYLLVQGVSGIAQLTSLVLESYPDNTRYAIQEKIKNVKGLIAQMYSGEEGIRPKSKEIKLSLKLFMDKLKKLGYNDKQQHVAHKLFFNPSFRSARGIRKTYVTTVKDKLEEDFPHGYGVCRHK